MRPFNHYNATSVDQAVALMKDHDGASNLIAGGTDLLGVLKDQILEKAPKALINLKSVTGFDTVDQDNDGITIGALARLCDLEKSDVIKEKYPVIADAAHSVATPEIRNMGTLGGNLCQDTRCWYYRYPHHMGGWVQCARKGKGPCLAVKGDNRYHSIFGGKKCFAVCPSDMALALAALEAAVEIQGPEGKRQLKLIDFYNSMGTGLAGGEILTRVFVPKKFEAFKQGYIKFRVRESVDFAVAGVACALDMQDGICRQASIVLGGVAPAPVRAEAAEQELTGRAITPQTAQAAARAAVATAKPLRRNEFKVQLVKTLVQRAVMGVTE